MGLFTPTAAEIKQAQTGGKIDWKDGEKPILMIKEFKEMPEKNLDIFICTVVGGEHDGMEQALFFRTNNQYDVEDGIKLLLQFFTMDQLTSKQASPVDMVGSKITVKVSLSPKKDGDGHFTNFKYHQRVDDTPDISGVGSTAEVSSTDIPF